MCNPPMSYSEEQSINLAVRDYTPNQKVLLMGGDGTVASGVRHARQAKPLSELLLV